MLAYSGDPQQLAQSIHEFIPYECIFSSAFALTHIECHAPYQETMFIGRLLNKNKINTFLYGIFICTGTKALFRA